MVGSFMPATWWRSMFNCKIFDVWFIALRLVHSWFMSRAGSSGGKRARDVRAASASDSSLIYNESMLFSIIARSMIETQYWCWREPLNNTFGQIPMIFFFSAAGGADEVIKKIRSKAMKATNYRNDIDMWLINGRCTWFQWAQSFIFLSFCICMTSLIWLINSELIMILHSELIILISTSMAMASQWKHAMRTMTQMTHVNAVLRALIYFHLTNTLNFELKLSILHSTQAFDYNIK